MRRAQEITFKAEIPTVSICPQYIHWLVEWKNGASWEPLYEFQSPDSRANEFTESGKLFTRFGAVGLKPGKEHRVAVAYKCTAPPEYPSSTCFSDFAYDGTYAGAPGFVPSAFRGGVSLPMVPSEFRASGISYQEMEDSFTRPSTLSKRSNTTAPFSVRGDGLGPDAVWLDSNPYSAIGNGARVSAAGGDYYAVFPQLATAVYAQEFSNSYSFVEAQFGRDSLNGSDVINFELHGRQFMDGSTLRSYWVKFLKNRLGAPNNHDILIGAPTCLGQIGDPPAPEQLPAPWICHSVGTENWLEMKRFTIPTSDPGLPDTDPNYKCYGFPSLTAGSNQKMWLQLRVQDDPFSNDDPHVYVIAAWDPASPDTECGTSGDITACPRVCRVDVSDPTFTLGDVMQGKAGHLMCSGHDANYRIWVVRGGSRP